MGDAFAADEDEEVGAGALRRELQYEVVAVAEATVLDDAIVEDEITEDGVAAREGEVLDELVVGDAEDIETLAEGEVEEALVDDDVVVVKVVVVSR